MQNGKAGCAQLRPLGPGERRHAAAPIGSTKTGQLLPGAIESRLSLDSCPKRLLSASVPREVAKSGGSQMNRAGAATSSEHLKPSCPYPTGTQLRTVDLSLWSCPRTPRHSLPLLTPEAPGATVSATLTSGARRPEKCGPASGLYGCQIESSYPSLGTGCRHCGPRPGSVTPSSAEMPLCWS